MGQTQHTKGNSYKPDNFPGLIPYLTVQDAEKSIEFYEKAFGFKVGSDLGRDEQGKITHAEMSFNDVTIMFTPEGAYGSPNKAPITSGAPACISLYVYCQDIDKLYKQAMSAGAQSLMEPNDAFWGDRVCQVSDPDGFQWMFATKNC